MNSTIVLLKTTSPACPSRTNGRHPAVAPAANHADGVPVAGARSPIARLAVALLVSAVTLAPAMTASAALIDDFVAGWTFDETSGDFADASSNSNDLTTDDSGTTDVAGAAGLIGNAFSGFGNAASNSGIGEFTVSDPFSTSFWVKYGNAFQVDQFQSFLGRRVLSSGINTDNWEGWGVRNGDSGERGKIALRFLSNNGTFSAQREIETTAELLTTGWQHIVVTHDGSGDLTTTTTKIYYNGVLQDTAQEGNAHSGTDTLLSDMVAENEDFVLGKRETSDSGVVDGLIDETGLWNRALTSDEVADLYNDGAGLSMNDLAIPEPASAAMFLIAISALLASRRRRR